MQTETVSPSSSPNTRGFEAQYAPEGKGLLCVMDRTGDNKIICDKHNEIEVAIAKAAFDTAKSKGFIAYTVNKDGSTGEVIQEFDPTAEKIILSPPMQGG